MVVPYHYLNRCANVRIESVAETIQDMWSPARTKTIIKSQKKTCAVTSYRFDEKPRRMVSCPKKFSVFNFNATPEPHRLTACVNFYDKQFLKKRQQISFRIKIFMKLAMWQVSSNDQLVPHKAGQKGKPKTRGTNDQNSGYKVIGRWLVT